MDTWQVKLSVTIGSATLVAERTDGSACPFSSVTYNLIYDWHPLRSSNRFKIENQTALEYGFPCYICVAPQSSGGES